MLWKFASCLVLTLCLALTMNAQSEKHSIYFDHDSKEVHAGAQEMLLDLIAKVQRQGGHIEIQGFTNKIGDSDYNYVLAEKRAQAVNEYFVKYSVKAEKVGAYGELATSGSCCKCDTNENRRVDVLIYNSEATASK